MFFIDIDDDKKISLQELKAEYITFRAEDPYNHAANFKTEFFNILMATINGRNDIDIYGPTPRELSNYIMKLKSII